MRSKSASLYKLSVVKFFLGFILLAFSIQTFASPDEDAEPTFPSTGTEIIEGMYIVSFKERNDYDHPVIAFPDYSKKGKVPVGKPTSGQSKEEIADALNLEGRIIAILEAINKIIIEASAEEAYRLQRDERVLSVNPGKLGTWTATQHNPLWALDRLDEATPLLDNTYTYTYTGAGRTIYILDSGLALSHPTVAAEFGGRASILWDWNGGTGEDTNGHGTMVASAAAGNLRGVAKGATVVVGKIEDNSTGKPHIPAITIALDWLAVNAPRGSIINISSGLTNDPINCSVPNIDTDLEDAVKAAHDAGLIVVVSAGNDGCDTANYSPTRIPEAFVVGATNSIFVSAYNQDAVAHFSRKGWNISTFAPGQAVTLMDHVGGWAWGNGTSFSAPYIAGIFAIACQAAGTLCDTATTAASLYTDLRNTGTLGTVVNTGGTPLTGATSRFIWQQW